MLALQSSNITAAVTTLLSASAANGTATPEAGAALSQAATDKPETVANATAVAAAQDVNATAAVLAAAQPPAAAVGRVAALAQAVMAGLRVPVEPGTIQAVGQPLRQPLQVAIGQVCNSHSR
jgi:hypothetical protein